MNKPETFHLFALPGGKEPVQTPAAKLPVLEDGIARSNPRTEVSVFKDGTTIVLEGFKACPGKKCHGALKPMSEFGFRRMRRPDGTEVIRTQSYCKDCR